MVWLAIRQKDKRIPKAINAFTARTHLGRIMRLASEHGETFILTKKGKPKVVVMGVKEYQDLVEVLAEEHDRDLRTAIKEAAAQIKRGEVSSLGALRAIYKAR
ncbi:MAG: type II toxin-antitoxin system Phd/YefM family antitoxin [Armatimonadetes bacterium]|nr:type II toxin-antitoxin system Phd/YefM family antitoxin [Armatimonadota bacterium]